MTDPVIDSIKRLDFDYQIIDCDPELADTAAFCASYGYQPSESANAILVGGKGDPRVYALCVVLADTQIDVNKTVRHKFGRKKASFASSDETRLSSLLSIKPVSRFAFSKSSSRRQLAMNAALVLTGHISTPSAMPASWSMASSRV